jgi:hypothetical protein
MDAADVNMEEQKFANFIGRIRANFKEIITKPLKLQMCMEFPELRDDENFLNQIDIMFSSNQTIEEWRKIKTFAKKIEAAGTMLGLNKTDGTPYFHIDWIINNVIKLTKEEIDENNSFWIKAKAGGAAATAGTGGEIGGAQSGDQSVEMGGQSAPAQGGAQVSAPGGQATPAQGGTETPPEQGGETGGTTEFDF